MLPFKQRIVQSLCLFYHTQQIKKYVCAPSLNFTVEEFKVELKLKGMQFSPGRRSTAGLFRSRNKSSSCKFTKMVRPVKGNGAVGICVGIYGIYLQSISI